MSDTTLINGKLTRFSKVFGNPKVIGHLDKFSFMSIGKSVNDGPYFDLKIEGTKGEAYRLTIPLTQMEKILDFYQSKKEENL